MPVTDILVMNLRLHIYIKCEKVCRGFFTHKCVVKLRALGRSMSRMLSLKLSVVSYIGVVPTYSNSASIAGFFLNFNKRWQSYSPCPPLLTWHNVNTRMDK